MERVYLDHAATTPPRPEVVEAMRPYLGEIFGNPSSVHGEGQPTRAALGDARARVAGVFGVRPTEVLFVRGGTESDNLAVLGSCRAKRRVTGRPTPLAVSAVEHSAVLEAARHAHDTGDADLTVFGVAADGSVDVDALRAVAARLHATVSVMWVNNETGLALPVAEVVAAVEDLDATVHTDASQAVGKVPIDLDDAPVDLLTATGHKIGGPRGTGVLVRREGTPLEPLIHGGGQESGLRPGTEDVAGAVGFAVALELATAERAGESARLGELRDELEARLRAGIPGLRVNGGAGTRAPHVCSVGVPGVVDGPGLLMALDLEGIAVSGGSACHSGASRTSHVISALYGPDDALATVRFSLGRDTKLSDIERAAVVTAAVVARLRGSEDAA